MASVLREKKVRTLVVGTGAAGYAAAVRLHQYGVRDLAILTENVKAGTSRNTGSDKQTYYKLSLAGKKRTASAAWRRSFSGDSAWTGIWPCARRLCPPGAFFI